MGNLTDINYGVGKYLTDSDATGIPDIAVNRQNLNNLNFKIATNNAYKLFNFNNHSMPNLILIIFLYTQLIQIVLFTKCHFKCL